ncbi:galactose-3-O-sulfotransferase 3-like, partial [Anneissia japonica]|uniref:galactose-3-O-sulfotransferase 3-like n=1 Tax=Anneissia japonica TaxID=1529436 RepID=UPI0014259155
MPIFGTVNPEAPFSRQMVKGQTNLKILASHSLYNRPEMDAVFGDALYVTILREPAAQFESAFAFFNMAKDLHLEQAESPIGTFMRNPKRYMGMQGFRYSERALNDQFRVLGLPSSAFLDESLIRYKFKQLEVQFDLVMINEYFDESLILLKNIFCWQFDDMLYLSKN